MTTLRRPLLAVLTILALTSCTRLFYTSMKKLGKEKRDILVSRIVEGKEAQQEAAEQFKSALEAFQAVTNFSGGNLEKAYNKLNGEFTDAEGRAKKVSDRIQSIDKVANDLFKEWGGEIEKMSNGKLKTDSRQLLRDAELRHRQLMRQMRASESKMAPVLQAFRDQVLFLKHNLNSRAISSLKKQVIEINTDVAALIKDIEAANQEADKTIAALNKDNAEE